MTETNDPKLKLPRSRKALILAGGILGAVALAGIAVADGASHRGDREGGWKKGHMETNFQRMLERYDRDGDNALSIEELRGGAIERVREYDADGDGALSLEEFEALWLDRTRERMEHVFQRLDADGDGRITEAEMVVHYVRMVERFDRDGDGLLTKDDFQRSKRSGDRKSKDKE